MPEDCCRTTEDGTTYCALPGNRQSEMPIQVKVGNKPASLWRAIRGGTMFVVACVFSPCCTPLLVPLALALAAGTPFAAWAALDLGLIYGVLTLVSVVSFILAWRWLQTKRADAPTQQYSPSQDAPKTSLLLNTTESRGWKNAN